jgi:CTP:molybdopterin cytidylyltransferase MocA
MKCGALILAAGASTRLGQPKQLIVLEGETLLGRSIRIAREAGCEPVVVVLGAYEALIRARCKFQDVSIISNADWADGMGTSLSRGAREFKDVLGIIVMTCDMPTVTADHLRNLASSGELRASAYAGRKGVPAYFPSSLFPQLIALSGETGAKGLLRSAVGTELNGGELDIDTVEDLAGLQDFTS